MIEVPYTVPNTFIGTVQSKSRTVGVAVVLAGLGRMSSGKGSKRMKLEIELDRDNGVPLTDQIVTGVTAWIRSRAAHPGSKLPSIRQFAADFGVSRFPVIEAYDRLVSLGYVDSRHGSGFYISDRQPAGTHCQGTSDPRRAGDGWGHLL